MAVPLPPLNLNSNQRADSSSYIGDSKFSNLFGSTNTGGNKNNFLQIGAIIALGFVGFYFFKKLR